MPLGYKIRQFSSECSWSKAELAARRGRHHCQICRCETGKLSPSVDVVVKFAETFDVPADNLLIDRSARPLRALIDLLGEHLARALARDALIHILDHMLTNNHDRAALTPTSAERLAARQQRDAAGHAQHALTHPAL